MTFGAGCFWCKEAVFHRQEGVEQVVPGYDGGPADDFSTVAAGRAACVRCGAW